METLFKDGITIGKFGRYVAPSVAMMVFISLYYIVDSIIVANFLGMNALAALSIDYPAQSLVWGICVMLAAGASALVAIKMGEGKIGEANRLFSLSLIVGFVLGLIYVVVILFFLNPILLFLGATDLIMDDCKIYMLIYTLGAPFTILGVLFEYYIRVDGNPGFTVWLYIGGGVVHIGLDLLFIAVWGMGIEGAAIACVSGTLTTFIFGLVYFLFKNKNLKVVRPMWDGRFVMHSFGNGSSELVTECATGIMALVFNLLSIQIAGEDGVAAVNIVLDLNYAIISVYLGYSMGVSPLISYFYGAKKYDYINVFVKYTRNFLVISGIILVVGVFLAAPLLVKVYTPAGSQVYDIAVTGMKYMAVTILLGGVNVFVTDFFTSYGNGKISALISFARNLVFVVLGAWLFTELLGLWGIWLGPISAELLTMVLSMWLLAKYRHVYHYKVF